MEISSPDKYLRYEPGFHFVHNQKNTDAYVQRMVETIENGTVNNGSLSTIISSAVVAASAFGMILA